MASPVNTVVAAWECLSNCWHDNKHKPSAYIGILSFRTGNGTHCTQDTADTWTTAADGYPSGVECVCVCEWDKDATLDTHHTWALGMGTDGQVDVGGGTCQHFAEKSFVSFYFILFYLFVEDFRQ